MYENLSPVWTHLTQFKAVRGNACYLYDNQGNKALDFTSGIGVVNTGHCHPKVVKAIQEQAENLLFGQMNCVIPQKTVELAGKLNAITPESINQFFFANSGAEATEACVKLAKYATKRQNIIVFQGSFHGRSHLTMAMTTSKTVYRHRYQPLPAGIFVAPFPNAFYYGWTEEETVEFCKKQLQLVFAGQTAPDETAAIIIEPVLGEGGYVPAPPTFINYLRKVCDEHGILLVLDEVQSGFGRTGKWFGFEYSSVLPDILVMAKGLGSGLPISGIGANAELMSKWMPGTHGGTYGGGSVVASATACATIEVIQEENLTENARIMGEYLRSRLSQLKEKYGYIGDVRGLGLMSATEFTTVDGKHDAETTKKVHSYCIKNNLLLLTCGSFGNVIRWIPPLIVTRTEIDLALEIFESALQQV